MSPQFSLIPVSYIWILHFLHCPWLLKALKFTVPRLGITVVISLSSREENTRIEKEYLKGKEDGKKLLKLFVDN